MKERIFKCITTFSVITAHFHLPFFIVCFRWAAGARLDVDDVRSVRAFTHTHTNTLLPKSERLVLIYGIVCTTLCKLFPRALFCCCSLFSYCTPDTSPWFSQVTHTPRDREREQNEFHSFTGSYTHTYRDLEKHFKVHATQPKCNNPVNLTYEYRLTLCVVLDLFSSCKKICFCLCSENLKISQKVCMFFSRNEGERVYTRNEHQSHFILPFFCKVVSIVRRAICTCAFFRFSKWVL